jgi:6-pyruvoyl-tetrahydropterin synthase
MKSWREWRFLWREGSLTRMESWGALDEAQTAVKQLLAGYNNRLLNHLKPYDQIQPTPENIARTLYEQVKAAIAPQPLRLKGLKVWASPTQYVWYSEQSRSAA